MLFDLDAYAMDAYGKTAYPLFLPLHNSAISAQVW